MTALPTTGYNIFAVSEQEMLGQGQIPLPYTVVTVRHGEVFQSVIYDVSGEAVCTRVADVLARGQNIDPTADAWWLGVDACAVFAGREPSDSPLQVWWRAATPQCQHALDRLGLSWTPQAISREPSQLGPLWDMYNDATPLV